MKHETTNQIMNYFDTSGKPQETIENLIGQLAMKIDMNLPDGPEKSAGLRKLLEAKDCFVRAGV